MEILDSRFKCLVFKHTPRSLAKSVCCRAGEPVMGVVGFTRSAISSVVYTVEILRRFDAFRLMVPLWIFYQSAILSER